MLKVFCIIILDIFPQDSEFYLFQSSLYFIVSIPQIFFILTWTSLPKLPILLTYRLSHKLYIMQDSYIVYITSCNFLVYFSYSQRMFRSF